MIIGTRLMPKRPCAIILTPDNSTILCADKFGDIYSLPIMGVTRETSPNKADVIGNSTNQANGPRRAPFNPSASSLTVHTKGNREALRQQQKASNRKAEQKALRFDYELLLGHVSLLTDVVCATVASPRGLRECILSSDRDEHIRVSRGMPQTHVIENYCLGHTEFVSKLCLPPAFPHLLLSGGGDDYLLLWKWTSGLIYQKVDIRSHVEAVKESYETNRDNSKPSVKPPDPENPQFNVSIRNIIFVNINDRNAFVVTCEG